MPPSYVSQLLTIFSNVPTRATTVTSFSPSYLPCAIFVGATSGIGQSVAQSFARQTQGNARIIVVGRNQEAAEATLAAFPKPTHPDARHEFISCDVSRMQNVRALSKELLARLPRLNVLVLSTGVLSVSGRDETDDGLDSKMALYYYARLALIHLLMPALERAERDGEAAKVMSVLAPGWNDEIDWNDLGLRRSFKASKVMGQCASYTDIAFEDLSKQHPGIAFVHANPGPVRSGQFSRSESWILRLIGPIVLCILWPIFHSQQVSAEYLLSSLLVSKDGFVRVGKNGENIGKFKFPSGSVELRERLLGHTLQATGLSSG